MQARSDTASTGMLKIILAISFFLSTPVNSQPGTLVISDPTGTPLNIRDPRSRKVICTAENGTRVKYLPKDGFLLDPPDPRWTLIRTKNGCQGLAWSQYLLPGY